MATVVVIITSMVVANATQTFATPNSAYITYSLAAGANSATITPIASKSVLVMGCCTTTGETAVGQVSVLHRPSAGFNWVGLESYGAAAITSGSWSIAGAHIVYIDVNHLVDIQVASVDTILIHNGSAITVAGNVTLVW